MRVRPDARPPLRLLSTVDFVQKGFVELSINAYDSPDSEGHPALRDPAFRNALQWAIGREPIAKIAWSGYATPATSLLTSGFTTDQIGAWSACQWSNAEFDRLYKQQQTELDPQKRKQMFWEMQRLL